MKAKRWRVKLPRSVWICVAVLIIGIFVSTVNACIVCWIPYQSLLDKVRKASKPSWLAQSTIKTSTAPVTR